MFNVSFTLTIKTVKSVGSHLVRNLQDMLTMPACIPLLVARRKLESWTFNHHRVLLLITLYYIKQRRQHERRIILYFSRPKIEKS